MSTEYPSQPPLIELQKVGVRFGHAQAIEDISLELPAGQVTALVGPSGCGKTTLLRVIAGLQKATAGAVLATPPVQPRDGQIGYVFQQPALLRWRTSLQNVALPIELLSKSASKRLCKIDDKAVTPTTLAEHWLQQVELPDVAMARWTGELSGGMQMRASIARALVTEPSLLLLDEPFAALDDVLRTRLGNLVKALHQEHQFTAVMVTHNIDEALMMADHVVVMRSGRIVLKVDAAPDGKLHQKLTDHSRDHEKHRSDTAGGLSQRIYDAMSGTSS